MNSTRLLLILFCANFMFAVCVSGGDDGELKYKTADELREACEPFLKPFSSKYRKAPDPDDDRLFIVEYLGAEDPDLQREAADILVELRDYNRKIRGNVFEKYLDKKYPMYVRDVALMYSMYNYRGNKGWEELHEKWKGVLNDIAEFPVPSPHFRRFAVGSLGYTGEWTTLIKADNQPIMLRRFLSVLSQEAMKNEHEMEAKSVAYVIARGFPKDLRNKQVPEWYASEPCADARRVLIDQICHGMSAAHHVAAVKPILELAAKDYDPMIAKKAQKELERLEPLDSDQ